MYIFKSRGKMSQGSVLDLLGWVMHSLENMIYTNQLKNILFYLSKGKLLGDLWNVCIGRNNCSQNPVFQQKRYNDIWCLEDDAEKVPMRMKVNPLKQWRK